MRRSTARAAAGLVALLRLLAPASAGEEAAALRVVRLPGNPIVRPEMLPGQDGSNINGPSLIRAPGWVRAPLGGYYLYFAHHGGRYIRLAVADALAGPWRIHEPGVLRLEQAPACVDHVASPDAVVVGREVRLYFHCPVGTADGAQMTFLARSADGVRFDVERPALGDAYFRVFRRGGAWYALAWGGRLFRSPDGVSPFEPGPSVFDAVASRLALSDTPGPRHVAIQDAGDALWVYYSSIGDEPERILRARIETRGPWRAWRVSAPQEVVRPETTYEGAALPLVRSRVGNAAGPEHALRDPFVFQEASRTYLLYSVAAESGIAIAELRGGRD